MLEFDMIDLEMLYYILNIEIMQFTGGIFVSQRKYVKESLEIFQMSN